MIPPPTDTSWLEAEPIRDFGWDTHNFLNRLLCRPGLRERFTRMENAMSALTDAVNKLTASVDAANARVTALIQPLQEALASAQSELADLKVQDDADKASLEAALTDATDATSRILDEVSQVDALGATPTPPAEPEVPTEPQV